MINKVERGIYYTTRVKILSDLLFFLCLLSETVSLVDEIEAIKKYIFILNIVCSKYIFMSQEGKILININRRYFFDTIINCLEIFLEEDSLNCDVTKSLEFRQKIILCKKVSRTRKKGRINRYKIVVILSDESGNWFGIGKAKDFYLYNAMLRARMNSLKNMFFIMDERDRLEKVTNVAKGQTILSFKNNKWSALPSSSSLLRCIANALQETNLSVKTVGKSNVSKILKLLLE